MHPTQNLVTDTVTPARTLRAAAGYLLHFGWYQGDLFADLDLVESGELTTPCACALGAIHITVLGTPVLVEWTTRQVDEYDVAVAALADHLVRNLGVADPNVLDLTNPNVAHAWWEKLISDWNDAAERICPQVVAALYGAADEWDRLHPSITCPQCRGEGERWYQGRGNDDYYRTACDTCAGTAGR
jgi:hypothetical protein